MKVGDKVVILDNNILMSYYRNGDIATVHEFRTDYNGEFIWVIMKDGCRQTIAIKDVCLKDIYESPLYKVMREE